MSTTLCGVFVESLGGFLVVRRFATRRLTGERLRELFTILMAKPDAVRA